MLLTPDFLILVCLISLALLALDFLRTSPHDKDDRDKQ